MSFYVQFMYNSMYNFCIKLWYFTIIYSSSNEQQKSAGSLEFIGFQRLLITYDKLRLEPPILGLHSHLFCELFDGMPDLCWFEGCTHFCLPAFLLVQRFWFKILYKKSGILKVGKVILKIGKTSVSTISRRSKRSFPSLPFATTRVQCHFPNLLYLLSIGKYSFCQFNTLLNYSPCLEFLH